MITGSDPFFPIHGNFFFPDRNSVLQFIYSITARFDGFPAMLRGYSHDNRNFPNFQGTGSMLHMDFPQRPFRVHLMNDLLNLRFRHWNVALIDELANHFPLIPFPHTSDKDGFAAAILILD